MNNPLHVPDLEPSHLVDTKNERADVPCGKCQLCCKTLIVPLAQEEYEQYDWAWVTTRDGRRLGRALKRHPNGDCVYLTDRGCSIHGRAPHVCQRFDCRELFLKSDRVGRRQAIRSGKIPKELFEKGREMSGQRYAGRPPGRPTDEQRAAYAKPRHHDQTSPYDGRPSVGTSDELLTKLKAGQR